MEADSPPPTLLLHSTDENYMKTNQQELQQPQNDSNNRRLNNSCEEIESADISIHPFNNVSNITVIEQQQQQQPPPEQESDKASTTTKQTIVQFEGSDSGVEVLEINETCPQRVHSSNSGNLQDFDGTNCGQSCDSSIISCCSNYEEVYNILVRRNSTLFEDYTLRNIGDGTSENGSESSSITGSLSSRNSKLCSNNIGGLKKKTGINVDNKKVLITKERSRSKPPITPKQTTTTTRGKSVERPQNSPKNKQKPMLNNLDLKKKSTPNRTQSSTIATTIKTPTDDGRWPSVNSKPAPLMSRSLRGILDAPKSKNIIMETKCIEKYATLPRRRKEKSADDIQKKQKHDDIVARLTGRKRETTPSRNSIITPNFLLKKKQKVKIYHETNIQTALTMSDVDKILAGNTIAPINPNTIEKCDQNEQVDMDLKELENLQLQLKQLQEKYEKLEKKHNEKIEELKRTEERLTEEILEKNGLKEELKINSQRVLAILGDGDTEDENASSDSLMVLESRFQNVSQIVIRQEEEISKLNSLCRALQIDLEKSLTTQRTLIQQHQDLENESNELQDFMQAEKTTLSEALKEAELEIMKQTNLVALKQKDLNEKCDEIKRLIKLNEQRWQENLSLQTKLSALEAKSRELLVHQGSSVSGTAVALSALINRLEGLVDELVTSYSISEQELEDVIFHNEAYTNSSSSPDATPEKSRKFTDKTPSPKKGSSFVSAVINAIKNAAAQSPFSVYRDISRDNLCTENSSSNEMLDSETEPCLMMEHVLEDVVIPDGHSHNMISSCHSLLTSQISNSDSLRDFTRNAVSLTSSYANDLTTSSLSDVFPSLSLIDQVIDVDNLVTKLLKVIRIIQLETDDCMNELQEQRDHLSEQVDKQKENNKFVIKQLKDWEILGCRLKTEVKDLMHQLSKKNNEIDKVKAELDNQRQQVEKLNQDVCDLSTALAKVELDTKIKEEQVCEAIKNWEKNGEALTADVLGRLIISHNEIPVLKDKLSEKERHLNELTQEFLASRQVLTESLKETISEAKKQYEAIDNALEVLHNNQNVVQQCSALAELQRELENTNFQCASSMPLTTTLPSDYNANAALLQAIANLQITPINTTA